MFKHITPYPWSTGNSQFKNTVWGYEGKLGQPLVAECASKMSPLRTQRANARLISIAPQMFEILQGLTDNEAAQELIRYMNREDA